MTLPYLVAVDDPWDDVAGNPNHRWEPVALTGAKLAATLKLQGPLVDATTTIGSDGRPTAVSFTNAAGVVKKVSARDLRQRLALRSTSFRLGVLRLESSQAAPDAPFQLGGIARDVDRAVAGAPRYGRVVGTGSADHASC